MPRTRRTTQAAGLDGRTVRSALTGLKRQMARGEAAIAENAELRKRVRVLERELKSVSTLLSRLGASGSGGNGRRRQRRQRRPSSPEVQARRLEALAKARQVRAANRAAAQAGGSS